MKSNGNRCNWKKSKEEFKINKNQSKGEWVKLKEKLNRRTT
jgi:hypothetical protein